MEFHDSPYDLFSLVRAHSAPTMTKNILKVQQPQPQLTAQYIVFDVIEHVYCGVMAVLKRQHVASFVRTECDKLVVVCYYHWQGVSGCAACVQISEFEINISTCKLTSTEHLPSFKPYTDDGASAGRPDTFFAKETEYHVKGDSSKPIDVCHSIPFSPKLKPRMPVLAECLFSPHGYVALHALSCGLHPVVPLCLSPETVIELLGG